MIGPETLLQNRYLISKQIGQGGMGAVYLATDQRFGSKVALKETFFSEPALRKAFEREAKLLNQLRHSALPRVSDHFTEDDGQFLVMEFIGGDDLGEMLKRQGGAFPSAEVLDWADQLLDALDYLHTQDHPVIHRDIKPQNLKLTPRGQIVLLDFGLAKGTPLQASQVTHSGSVFGYSRNYAPLEQIQGTGTDTRSDLYSLAATLYHLITGETPPDALTRASAVLNAQPDPLKPANEVHSQVSPALAKVLTSAMSQNSNNRPQTASEMRAALREAAKSPVVTGQFSTLADTTPILEQDTQLMDGRTGAIPPGATGLAAEEKQSIASTADLTVAGAAPTTTEVIEEASVVTSVAAATPNPRRHSKALTIAAILIGALMVSAGVYTFSRRSTANTPTVPPATEAPQTNAGPPAQESPPNAEETLAPSNSNTAAPERKASNANRQSGETSTTPRKTGTKGATVTTPPDPDEPNVPPRDNDNDSYDTTAEVRAAELEARRARRRAAQERRRALEAQRRARQGLPPPPP